MRKRHKKKVRQLVEALDRVVQAARKAQVVLRAWGDDVASVARNARLLRTGKQ